MDKDKENVDGNLSVDVVKSSQGSPFTSNTQSLHLELLDEDVDTSETSDNKVLNSQTMSQGEMSATEMPSIGASPSEMLHKNEKRSATEALTDIDEQNPGKLPKKEISVITLSDSFNESSENTFSLNELQADESRQSTSIADDSVIVVESQEPSFENIPPTKTLILTDNNSPAVVNYPETSTPGRLTDCGTKDDGKTAVNISQSPVSEKETIPLVTSNFDQNLKNKDGDTLVSAVDENEHEVKSASQPVNEDDKDTTLPMSSPEDDGYVMVAMKAKDFRRLTDTKDYEVLGNWQYVGDLGEIGSRLKPKSVFLSKRLSEFSSLSGGSSGYNADSSSGISSEGSKRDRLSILPEARIDPHHVISPLPTPSFRKPKVQTKSTIPPPPRTTDYELELEMRVFAKWVEKTTVKYWAGKVHEIIEENQRFIVRFDDGYDKSLKKEDILPADSLIPGNRVNLIDEEKLTHNQGMILSYADLTTPNMIFYELQLESQNSDDPAEPVKKVSHSQLHMELDQWNEIKGEIKGSHTKMADVSLDNLLMGKRRSKPMTPIKETPTKTPKKRGGSNVETSATEEEENISLRKKIRKRANEKRKINLPETTDDEAKHGKSASSKKSDLFKGLKFMLTQGKHNPEEKDLSGMDSETEEEEEEEDSLKEEVFDKKSLRKKIIDHSGTVLAKFPDKSKEKISSNVSSKLSLRGVVRLVNI